MKKYYFLIVLALILGLVLAGCTFLSNIGQVPTSGQSGITYLTKGTLVPGNLVGLWHFDGDATDSSGNGNLGILQGDAGFDTGMFGQALSVDGAGDYVDFGSGVTASITGDYTVEAWIKPASLDSGRHAVMSFRYMELGHDAGKVYFWQAYDSSWGKGYEYISPTVLLDVTKFSHIVGVFHEDAGVDLYVDGIYIGSNTTKTGTTLNIFSKTYAGVWYTAGGGWFNGIIDEVRIWNTALTANQIQQSMASPLPVIVTTSRLGSDSVPAGTTQNFYITITVCNYDALNNPTDVVVQGGIGADLDITYVNNQEVIHPMEKKTSQVFEDVTLTKKGGKMGATIVSWDIDTFPIGECLPLDLVVQTGENPAGKQEFTSTGPHELDGGFSATYTYLGEEYKTPETDPLTVDVVPAP